MFEDDFNDGLDDLWEQTLGKWQVANRQLTTVGNCEWATLTLGDFDWSNYAVEVDCHTPLLYSNMGIYVRQQEDGSDMGFFYQSGSYYIPRFLRKEGGNFMSVAKASQRGGFHSPDAKVRLEVRGNESVAYINGSEYVSTFDSTFSSGRVALTMQCSANTFDNFKVTALD